MKEWWNSSSENLVASSSSVLSVSSSMERGGGTAGGRARAARRWFVRVSKWHVNVDCGQYRRRTSEGRPTFFPSQHTDKSISSRAVVSRFPAAPASTAGSLTHRDYRPRWNRPPFPTIRPFSTILRSLLFFILLEPSSNTLSFLADLRSSIPAHFPFSKPVFGSLFNDPFVSVIWRV